MSALHLVYLVIFVCAVARIIRDNYQLVQNLRWISSNDVTVNLKPRTKFIICIPVMNEQRVITQTFDYFLKLKYPKSLYTVIYVTTQNEGMAKGSTNSIIRDKIESLSAKEATQVRLFHYPNEDGVMAQQINYAAELLEKELSSQETYLTIYNGDSRPNPNTLTWIDAHIQEYIIRTKDNPKLLQQSSIYTTVPCKDPSITNFIASGATIHQSLWTLTQEMTRFRVQTRGIAQLGQSKSIGKIIRYSRIAHCVGHGLFIHGQHFLSSKLPEELLNEDLPYGLLQTAQRHAILPVQLLEIAESPNKLKNVYMQKKTWFNPFFEFLGYAQSIKQNGLYVSKFELVFLTIQAYLPLILWLFRSFLWIALLVAGLILGPIYIALALICFATYWFVPAYIYKGAVRRMHWDVTCDVKSIIGGSFYALTDSVGPVLSVVSLVIAYLKREPISKQKTENA
jgi:hypothetical protein